LRIRFFWFGVSPGFCYHSITYFGIQEFIRSLAFSSIAVLPRDWFGALVTWLTSDVSTLTRDGASLCPSTTRHRTLKECNNEILWTSLTTALVLANRSLSRSGHIGKKQKISVAWQASHQGEPERVLTGKNKGFILMGSTYSNGIMKLFGERRVFLPLILGLQVTSPWWKNDK
jgi:hypothetical protein